MSKAYRVSELVSIAMPVSTGVMLFTGILLWKSEWLPAGLEPLLKPMCLAAFAIMGVSAVIAGACMAAHAMAAFASDRRFRGLAWAALAFSSGFALVGALGVHIGWEVLTKPNMADMALPSSAVIVAASLFLAFAKNAFWFVLEGRKQVDRYVEAEADKAVREEAEKREERQEQRKRFAVINGIGAIGAAAALAGAGFAAPAPEAPPIEETALSPALEARTPQAVQEAAFRPTSKHAERFARYMDLREAGAGIIQAAKMADVPIRTAYWWEERINA